MCLLVQTTSSRRLSSISTTKTEPHLLETSSSPAELQHLCRSLCCLFWFHSSHYLRSVPRLPLQAVNTSVFIKNQITGGKIERSLAAVNHLTGAQRGQQLHSSVSTALIKYEKQNSLFFKHQGHFASIYYLITVLYYEF